MPTGLAVAQSLPDSLLERVRAGATRIVLPGDSVALPLIGTPTLPLVEVGVNGTGPYRFLIDLGSNVTLLRKNIVDASGSTVLVDRPTSDIVHVEAIALGDARLEDVTVGSYDELDVDGVLGYNVLRLSSFTLDFPAQRLVLTATRVTRPTAKPSFPMSLKAGCLTSPLASVATRCS